MITHPAIIKVQTASGVQVIPRCTVMGAASIYAALDALP